MKVRMLTHTIGVPQYHIGQIVDLEPRIAKAWIEDGLAAPVGPAPVQPGSPAVPTADAPRT
jgi:hypothetical protein